MNDPRRRGPIARFFQGLWDAVNFARRLVFNLVFLAILLLFIGILASGDAARPLADRTTLVIAPEGRLVEQFSSDPTSRALARMFGDDSEREVQLRDVLRALEVAKDDKRIERVLLRTDRMTFSGYASIREVAHALAALRASGKQVVAFGEGFDQNQYLLAAQADEVYLDPMGWLLLEGLSRYRQYYREGLQDKLGVDVHVFKVGEYKSAVEPFVLDAASPEAREADLFWMNDIWQRYLGDVAKARDIPLARLAAGIETSPEDIVAAGGDLARHALDHALVDGLKTEQEVLDLLAGRGVADDSSEHGFREVSLDAYLKHLDRGLEAVDERPQVAVVVAEGEIVGGEQPPGSIGGESTAQVLREARDDEAVKSVVLRVNSPGGSAYASEQIRREVAALQEAGKPVVVSMGDLAASGGYWISMDADRIYANPSTITGSIGIYGLFPTIPRTLDRIGVHTDGVGTTPFAGAFDITRPLDPRVGQVIQSVIDKGYRDFISRAAEGRDRSVAQIDEVARGRVWTGAQARERGLVDAFGGLPDAIADAATRAKLGDKGDYRVRYMERKATPFERFFGSLAESRIGTGLLRDSGLARSLLASALPQAHRDLRFLEAALQPGAGSPVKALAYCFCGP
ncbi:MAG: signal peptide peptidase SppA [Pseudomonadota bacterium]|nr:signal peptide peptidase SppA [Pseudomonadota bacterium]